MQQIVSNLDVHMNRKLKSSIAFFSALLVAVLAFGQVQINEKGLFCSCPQNSQFDTQLPLSHPINRCATSQAEGVSWTSWFAGGTNSSQFHYLDLLELLSRHTTSSTKQKQHTS
jgi:hypothetical protein